jgi:molecular chaperone DnaJ
MARDNRNGNGNGNGNGDGDANDNGQSSGGADYYDILGVSDSATADDILRAYRRLVREHHPDHNPAGGSKRFQEITGAYDVIGDADRRRQYDRQRRGQGGRGIRIPVNRGPSGGAAAGPGAAAAERGSADGGPGPGAAAPSSPAPADRPVVRLSFQEAVLGTVTTVEVTEERACPRCGGTGLEQPDPGGCPECGGRGSVVRGTGQIPVRHVCARCAGRGRAAPRACPACGASGAVTAARPVKVRVPAGVADGAMLRIPRKDRAAIEALVRVESDPVFGRDGDHVTVRVPVTPAEAALGATIEVPTPGGRPVAVRLPAGTQPGRRLRVAGHGVRRADRRQGDLLVTVEVVVPTVLSDAEREAYEQLRAVSENPRAPN